MLCFPSSRPISDAVVLLDIFQCVSRAVVSGKTGTVLICFSIRGSIPPFAALLGIFGGYVAQIFAVLFEFSGAVVVFRESGCLKYLLKRFCLMLID